MKKKTFTVYFSVAALLLILSFGLGSCSHQTRASQNSISPVPSASTPSVSVATTSHSEDIRKWCESLNQRMKAYRWPEDPCLVKNWKVGGHSVEGRPLVYGEFGNPKSSNITLILSMVHGDEHTPLFLGLRLAKWLEDNESVFQNAKIIIAPLVNPDGFFKDPQKRVNARGVDLNRNFDTKDWHLRALQNWKKTYRSDPRRFPGDAPESEVETQFQINLIHQFNPQKIISVHAPLNFLDYDGPNTLELKDFPKEYVQKCLQLRSKIQAISGKFYPGSLGNYAGQERGVPTFTLELPTGNPKHALNYWRRFKPGIRTVIDFLVTEEVSRRTE